jgi:hypothetical protein
MDPRHIIDRIFDLTEALRLSTKDHEVLVRRIDGGRPYSHQARLLELARAEADTLSGELAKLKAVLG